MGPVKPGQPDPANVYNHLSVEAHWQNVWQQSQTYEVDLAAAAHPFYNLMMFPYPSAEGLHVGNVYAFTGADIYGRFMAMQGRAVFEPMGFDAFGIHSENFAIKKGIHPGLLTAQNVERFRETQLKRIGNRFCWNYEVQTTDPSYYKWTQWIFLQLFKAGLAVRKKAQVNWCPSCKTVLADEQVIAGECERCSTLVTQRELEQWFFKIANYAQRLLDNLDRLDWSEKVKAAQRNWIGRSEGLQFNLHLAESELQIAVFTTRPDTIFGMTYVVLAPEHPLVDRIVTEEYCQAIATYKEHASRQSEFARTTHQSKTGVFTGAYAIHPLTQERIPIWIADYVLSSYGTGAVMAVPAHDDRDFQFAKTMGLPIRQVVIPISASSTAPPELDTAFTDHGTLIESGRFTGLASKDAIQQIIQWFEQQNLGDRTVQFRLRDWLISRQRYWGPPIPIVYCGICGIVPVPEEKLPVHLPETEDWLPRGTGTSPLAQIDSFVNTICPCCGGAAHRETDVSDNFLDSAWYFLRYPSSKYNDVPFDAQITAKWLPVNMYIGGAEHSVLHLLYSRFITMVLHDLGYIEFEEPFECFRAHGLLTKDGAKMSKSKGNVVNPDEYIEEYGADTLRTYLMFLGPYHQGGDFSDRGIVGMRRFLNRVWQLVSKHRHCLESSSPDLDSRRRLHQTINKVSEDIQALKYNTAIAALMEYLNALQLKPSLCEVELKSYLLMLAPFAPHLTEELWHQIGESSSIHQQTFPQANPEFLTQEQVTITVQINGRKRATILLSPSASQQEAIAIAKQTQSVQRYLENQEISRVVYVPGRILNLVT
ncbi:leucine--tRNA ligase [Nostoc sp. ATCC 43529]|nr:leucine--tRNA ligase [Nostoc sp. ATCC 43529]